MYKNWAFLSDYNQIIDLYVSNFPQTNISTQFKACNTFFTIEPHIKDFMVEELGAHMYARILYFIFVLAFLDFFPRVFHFYVFFSCCLSSTSLKDLFFHSSSLFRIPLISRASKKMKKIYLTNSRRRGWEASSFVQVFGEKNKNI